MILANRTVEAYWDELEKIAATVAELHAGRNRLGILRTPVPKRILSRADLISKGTIPAMAIMGGGAGIISNEKALKGTLPKSGHGSGLTRAAVQKQMAEAAKTPLIQRHGGTPIQSKGDTTKRIQKSLSLPAMSGEGRKASNIMMGLHEGFERKAMGRPKEIAAGFGHLSPRVIMDETNLAKKMTGPGADEARAFQKAIRAKGGEAAALDHALRQVYGQRGVDYVKEHGYSKAMKKDLMRRYSSGELKFEAPLTKAEEMKRALREERINRVKQRTAEKYKALRSKETRRAAQEAQARLSKQRALEALNAPPTFLRDRIAQRPTTHLKDRIAQGTKGAVPPHLEKFRSNAPKGTLSRLQQMAKKLVMRR